MRIRVSLVGFVVFSVCIGAILYGVLVNLQYDKDCLNKIADEVCRENGYCYGEGGWNNKPIIYCYKSNRSLTYSEKMDFTDSELNKCKKNANNKNN